MKNRTFWFLFVGILALGAFLRFYDIKNIPIGLYPDEAMNGSNAQEGLATGNFHVFYPENNGREGLFMNVQAISIAVFGPTPWALRLVSAVVGTLTILGVYLVTRELFPDPPPPVGFSDTSDGKKTGSSFSSRSRSIALIAAFFIATSYWHLNFSRIGFRAICLPLFASFGLYWMLKAMRTSRIGDWVLSGIMIGLGFQTYIAFRFMPFVVMVPGILYLLKNRKAQSADRKGIHCGPCAILLFIFVIFITALPIGIYFLNHPQAFSGRSPTDQPISVFSTPSPIVAFLKSNLQTLGMFFVRGDCNWRHNYACQPELHLIVAIFFVLGIWTGIRYLIHQRHEYTRFAIGTLFGWMVFMSLPETLTKERIPHALRSIGMIPPVMILAALGMWDILHLILNWLERQKSKYPAYHIQLHRIQREVGWLFVLLLLIIPLNTYYTYFLLWAGSKEAYFEFSTDYVHIGEYLNGIPDETPKYIIVNRGGVDVRGIPSSAQTIMYLTNTFVDQNRIKKNYHYITPDNLSAIPDLTGTNAIVTFLNGSDQETKKRIKENHPELQKQFAPEIGRASCRERVYVLV